MMKTLLSPLFLLMTLLLIAQKQPGKLPAPVDEVRIQEQTIVIKFKSGVSLIPADFKLGRVDHPVINKGIQIEKVEVPFKNVSINGRVESKSGLDFTRYQIIKLDNKESISQVLAELNQMKEIEYAEPLYAYRSFFEPNDFSLDAQREYLEPVRALEAWDITQGSSDVVVAIIDSGVDYEHEDLKNKVQVNEGEVPDNGIDDDQDGYIDNYYGWDFAGEDYNNIIQDNDPIAKSPNIDHGTWVAGFAAAETNNEIGMAGVGFNSKYMALKCGAENDTRDTGDAFLLNTLSAVIYAADHGADVINMSYGGTTYSQFGQDVMTYAAIEKGVVLVAAAGNAGVETVNYPAGFDHVLAIAATDEDDEKTDFTNFGTWIDLSAPGDGILTTGINDGYQSVTGTSFSSPIVAGAAALVKAKYPDFTPFQISQLLVQSADFIDTVNAITVAGKLGTGRLNIERALSIEVPAFDLLDVSILNDNNEKPGRSETGQIDITFRNALFNSSASARFSIYLLDTVSQVSFDNESIDLGVVSTGEEILLDNIGTVTIDPEETFNKSIPFSIVFEDADFNYKDSINFTVLVNPLRTNPKTTPYLLTDGGDFETVLDDFQSATLFGDIDVWELGVPGNVLTTTNSGVNAWKTLLEEDLPQESFASVLQSPVFDFSDQTKDYRLNFYKSMQSSFCNAPAAVQLQYSLDGENWQVLGAKGDQGSVNWYNKAPDDECAIDPSIIPDQKGWLGNFSNEETEYNVSFLSGNQEVIFRFVLYMSGLFDGDTDDGFMIDDFQIETRDPSAAFTSNRRVIYTGESVAFSYLSGGASSFSWDFGDGTTSSDNDPTHTFDTPGKYDISLTIGSSAGSADSTIANMITVLPNLNTALTENAGGDFESNQGYFGAENIAGSGFTLGNDTIAGKDGTASGEYAWVVGLGVEQYEDESEAYLYSPNFDFEFIGNYRLGFKSKFQFEDTWDGFIVEYSLDKGENWTKLNAEVSEGWYTTTSNALSVFGASVPIFSGSTDGEYQSFETDISFLSGQDNVAFRFVFLTDQNTVDVGMALDDFFISYPQTGTLEADFIAEGYIGCVGQTITFLSTSVGSISEMNWNFGDKAVPSTATGPGPHEVTYDSIGVEKVVLSISGLGTSDNKTFDVLTGPEHAPTFTYTFNDRGNADLLASEGDSYQWLLNNEPIEGANDQTYEASERGRYSVEVTLDGCPSTSPLEVFIITAVDEDFPFTIYPNPSTDGIIQLKGIKDQSSSLQYQVFDLSGKTWIPETQLIGNSPVLDLSDLPKGQYVIKITEGNQTYRAKVLYQ